MTFSKCHSPVVHSLALDTPSGFTADQPAVNEQRGPDTDRQVTVPKHVSGFNPHPVSYGLDGRISVLWEPNVTGDCHPKDILVPFTYIKDVSF